MKNTSMLFWNETLFLAWRRRGEGQWGCWAPRSCQLQFQPHIPTTRQQPLTNLHCQNAHLSKVISFVKSFYGANKTLKLLTHGEVQEQLLTIRSRWIEMLFKKAGKLKGEKKKESSKLISRVIPLKETAHDSRFKPDGCKSLPARGAKAVSQCGLS